MTDKLLHLQGLRAVAITSVIFFHFFPKLVPNGYLGVDQFFLLSGFFMTMMAERNLSLSLPSIADFFYRRIKRIVPLYYLATFVIAISINFAPPGALQTNLKSGVQALFFASNVMRPSDLETYEDKMVNSVDMFSHTWSLSVEMQFYVLFPMLLYLTKAVGKKYRNGAIMGLSLVSFMHHSHTDPFLLFYCLFSRIWQFMAGMFIFYGCQRDTQCDKDTDLKKKLLDPEAEMIKEENHPTLVSKMALIILVFLLGSQTEIDHLFGRVNVILLTILLVYSGAKCWLLENRAMVFVGEISYSWYLVHWPIVAMFRMKEFTSDEYMLLGTIVSFLLTVAIYYSFEIYYRSWGSGTIFSVISTLFLLNAAVLIYVSQRQPSDTILSTYQPRAETSRETVTVPYGYESDVLNEMLFGYENKTKEERADLNLFMDRDDVHQVERYPCMKLSVISEKERRCRMQENNADSKTNLTLVIIGNSWAGNGMNTIFEQCKGAFRNIYSAWTPACEPLVAGLNPRPSKQECSFDSFFLNTVKEFKADVVIMPFRHYDTLQIVNGTNPFNDQIFKTMVQRLKELEEHVSKRIYLLDHMQWPKGDLATKIENFLRKDEPFDEADVIDGRWREHHTGRERMARLAQECSKCRLYDYSGQFYVNGRYQLYDPKYYVRYFANGLHISPVGLARIAPMYLHICNNV